VQQAQLGALGAYLGAMELAGNAGVLEQRLRSLRAHLQIVDDQFAHGLVARNDLLETQVRVRAVEDDSAAVASRRAIAVRDLNRQLGRDPDTEVILPDSLPPPPSLPGDRRQLAASAQTANPGLRAAAARLAAGRSGSSLARRAYWPSLFLAGSHNWMQNDILLYPHVNALVAGVNWDVFDGGIRQAAVRQADAAILAAARDHLEAQRAVAIAVASAWDDWEQALREERTARANVAAAVENLRIIEDQYRAGLARTSDALDAEALLAASRFSVVAKHYATYRAQAELLAAAGTDLVAFYAGSAAGGER
jgi:outer membrane protein TolC